MPAKNPLLQSCEECRNELVDAMANILKVIKRYKRRSLLPGPGEPNNWVFDAWLQVKRLYEVELEMIDVIEARSGIARLHEASDDILKADEDPENEKALLHHFYNPRIADQLKRRLRDMVASHWQLVRKAEGPDAVSVQRLGLREHMNSIRQVLGELRWLFGVFVCYASEDSVVVEKVIRTIQGELKKREIDIWRDREENRQRLSRLPPGKDYTDNILEMIERRDVGLVFLSKHARESPFITTVECPRLEERHEEAGRLVIPLIVSSDGVQKDWLDRLECVPSRGELNNPTAKTDWEKLCLECITKPIIKHYNGGVPPETQSRSRTI